MTGSAQGANTSLRYNRGQLGKRPNMFKKDWSYKNAKNNYINASGGTEQYKKLNNFQKKLIRAQIRKEQSSDRKKMILLMSVIVGIFIVSLLKLIYGPDNNNTEIRALNKEKQKPDLKEEQYLEYLVSGDNWIEDDKWDAAIILYEKALKIYPGSYDAKYRLVLAYSYKCERMKFDCDLGKTLTRKLLIDNPKHKNELVKLDSIFTSNLSEPVIIGN